MRLFFRVVTLLRTLRGVGVEDGKNIYVLLKKHLNILSTTVFIQTELFDEREIIIQFLNTNTRGTNCIVLE